MDQLGVQRADLLGYSMGGFISTSLLLRYTHRWRSVILGGVGDMVLGGAYPRERSEAIARAMTATTAAADGGRGESDLARGFRLFAERAGNDLEALAAMQHGPRERFDASKLGEVKLPVLVLVGSGDAIIGSADRLAATIPGAKYVKLDGDHLTVFGNPLLRQAIIEFLAEASPAGGVA
jgi:pimeloyl-ACP methyl ester carboxylesterase